MDTQNFSEWLAGMSVSERVRALLQIYSLLTVNPQELFLPDATKGREEVVLNMLHGMNEIHHTLANWLGNYLTDATKAFPVETLSQQLSQIGNHYRIDGWPTSAIQRAQSDGRTDNLTADTSLFGPAQDANKSYRSCAPVLFSIRSQ
jgi:hypothetical protein